MRHLLTLFLLLVLNPAQAAVEVQDGVGNTVRLAQPARRIVSLAPHLTENLFAAGAGAQVVGAPSYSDYPEAARNIPRIGGYQGLDLEAIVALRPDLITAWDSGNPPEVIARLRAMGFTVYVSELRRLEDIPAEIKRLGTLAGTEAVARAAVADFRNKLAELRKTYSKAAPVSVFYQIWHQPLMTVNGEHLISNVLTLCGARNVFADLPALTPRLDVEAVLAADPEAIVGGGMGDERPQWLDDWRAWSHLQAVRDDNLFFVPPDLMQRPTPRILQGAERVCAAMALARQRREAR